MEKNKEVKYGCFIDGCDEACCVFDNCQDLTISDCDVAERLHKDGLTKEDCEYWRPIPYTTAVETVCTCSIEHKYIALKNAVIELLSHREGRPPFLGYIHDNDKSREIISKIANIVGL